MKERTFTTRAEAAAPPAELVHLMAQASYEASRGPGSTRPPFGDTSPSWQAQAKAEMAAAIQAAEAAGWRTSR